jgi:Ca2+-binding RTX toxin-like protein
VLIKAKTQIGPGVLYDLAAGDDLLVGAGVTIYASEGGFAAGAIVGEFTTSVRVEGMVISRETAIELLGDNSTITVAETGSVISIDDWAAVMALHNAKLVNRGYIEGFRGLFFGAPALAADERAIVVNYGKIISAFDAIQIEGQGSLIRNFGLIRTQAENDTDCILGNAFRDQVINRGTIFGTVRLFDGNDLYDGRNGKLVGTVEGGAGNDIFRPGVLAETLKGEEDIDTLDFRKGPGIRVDLDGQVANTGFAKGDSLDGFEIVLGSAKGKDQLRGDASGNDVRGLGGNDLLVGREGADTLTGGLGADKIDVTEATADQDQIVFRSALEVGDMVTGFTLFDEVMIRAAGFKGGLAAGALAEERFKSGGNNKAAEADDRFIFRSGDTTLWFDRDGHKAEFAPVLIADFDAGTLITHLSLTLF